MNLRGWTLLFILSLAPLLLRADDASRIAKVEELFQLMGMEKTYGQMMDLVMKQTNAAAMQRLLGIEVPGSLQAELQQFQDKVEAVVKKHMGWDAVKTDYVRLYEEAFTEEELDAILAFHRTPAGRAMIRKQPALMEKSSAIAQERMAGASPEIQRLMAEWMETVKRQLGPQ